MSFKAAGFREFELQREIVKTGPRKILHRSKICIHRLHVFPRTMADPLTKWHSLLPTTPFRILQILLYGHAINVLASVSS